MFINPDCEIDRVNCGQLPYTIGPAPLVIYTLDDYRVEVNSAAGAQLAVQQKPGILDSKNCIELMTTIQKGSTAADDNDNLERWIDVDDLRRMCAWGTPYAQPLTISFDAEAAIAGDYTFAFINWCDTVYCAGRITLSTPSRVSITFPAMTTGDWSQGGKFLTDLGSGATFETAIEGSWQSGHAWHITGTQRLTAQPFGSYLRFGRFQADAGLVAQPYRYIPIEQQRASANRYLWSTFPEGTPINNAVRGGAAGVNGALKILVTSASAGAGWLYDVRFPVEMVLPPTLYPFSPRFVNDHNWYRANGDFSSDAADFWNGNTNSVGVHYPNTNDPNGSIVYLHLVACCQRGGNGVLPFL